MAKKIPTRRVSSPFLIGIFVIVGSILIIAALIWLGANRFLQERTRYVTYFNQSIEGLENGSAVKYLGVPVGNVQNVGVAPDGKLIEVVFQIDKKIEITDSIRAKAELTGIAGGKFIQLYRPEDKKIRDLHPKLDFKPEYPLVPSAPSGIQEIELAMRDIMNKLQKIEYQKISEATVNFMNSTSDFFRNKDLYDMIANLRETSRRFASLVTKADTSKTLDYIANASARLFQTSNELKNFAENLNTQVENMQLDKQVDKAFSRYDSTMRNTDQAISNLSYRASALMLSLEETIVDIQKTNKELQRSLRVISEQPSQVFFSEPPPVKE